MTEPNLDLDADEIFGARDPMAEPEPVAPATAVPIQHISEVMADVVRALDAGPPPVIPTPFYGLNYLLDGGFRPGEFIILGARRSVGKTALALEMARFAAKHKPVLVVSREMVNAALARRLVAQEGRVNASSLRKHALSPEDMAHFAQGMERLAALDLWLTDAALSLAHVEAIVEKPPAKVTAWGLVIVDYLQLVRAPAGCSDRRAQIEAVSSGLKALAVASKVPLLCLSSLRRPPDGGNPRPTMADLKESSNLEHDADIIIMLHREDNADGSRNTVIEMNVEKNRDGDTGRRELVFSPEFVSFAAREFGGG